MKIKLVESLDNLGHELSKEQELYFKNSKMKSGNDLIVFYNSGSRKNRTIYNCDKYPYFFTELENYSKEYGDITYSVYLNITNPVRKVDKLLLDMINNEFMQYCSNNNITPLGINEVKINKYLPFPLIDTLYYYLRDYTSYDGILAEEFGSETSYYKQFGPKGQVSYIPFYSNQIKLISNKFPTSSDYIDR